MGFLYSDHVFDKIVICALIQESMTQLLFLF